MLTSLSLKSAGVLLRRLKGGSYFLPQRCDLFWPAPRIESAYRFQDIAHSGVIAAVCI